MKSAEGVKETAAVDVFLREEGVARLERMRAKVDEIEKEIANVTDLLLWCTAQSHAPRGSKPPGAPYMVDIGLKVFIPAVTEASPTKLSVQCGVGVYVEMTCDEAAAFAQTRLDALSAKRSAAIRALARCTTIVLSLSHPPVRRT